MTQTARSNPGGSTQLLQEPRDKSTEQHSEAAVVLAALCLAFRGLLLTRVQDYNFQEVLLLPFIRLCVHCASDKVFVV